MFILNIVIWFCKMLALGKVRWRYTGTLCLRFFLQVENLNFKISNYFKIYFLSARFSKQTKPISEESLIGLVFQQ